MNDSLLLTKPRSDDSLLQDSQILVVDDSPIMREVVTAILKERGVKDVMQAEDGLDACKKLRDFSPDLIILDLAMPKMDGRKFCEWFRKSPYPKNDIPIIVLTGEERSDERIRALRVGASSIFFKPVKQNTLIERVVWHLREAQLLKQLASGQAASAEDIRTVTQMQAQLFPSQEALASCRDTHHIQVDAHYQPSDLFGGDYWTVQPIDEHRMAFFMADFSGHGIPPAIYTFRLHKFLREYTKFYATPAEVLAALNQVLCQFLPLGTFLSCVLGFIDRSSNRLTYSAAGHPSMILCRQDDSMWLPCDGFLVGFCDVAAYENREWQLQAGDTIFLNSDALVEVNEQGHLPLSDSDLFTMLKAIPKTGQDTVLKHVLSKLSGTPHHFDDDLTLLTLHLL